MKPLLRPQQLHDYQKQCVLHQMYHDDSMLWVGMGLGKTITTLTTIVDRMRAGQVKKTLIFGPLRVIQAVWTREARKWEHTKHLRFSVIHGNKDKRQRALFADADIYLINYENMNYLAEQLDHYYLSLGKPLPFEFVVYDEVSKLKNSTTLRMKGGTRDRKDKFGDEYQIKVTGWRKIIPHFKYRTGLTGTPASNGYMDLHGQFLAVDGGQRLGEYVTHYKDSYFESDYMGWNYVPTGKGKALIEQKISDITLKMDSKDYLDMPDVKEVNLMVDLPVKARKAYDEVERNMFTQLDNGSEIEVFSRSSVSNKTLQFCNGSPYLSAESDEFEAVHDAKLDALDDVLEEAGGSPVLCSYTFKSDAKRIMKKFSKYRPVNLTETPSKDTENVINRWNRGEIKLLIGHPACLHPSTEVLTERNGWTRIVDVEDDDRVFDGIEFVKHKGCQYSGHKEVIEVFGMKMTPEHKLLIDGVWVEAKHVDDSENTRQKALYEHEVDANGVSQMFKVRNRIRNRETECGQKYSSGKGVLSTLCRGSIPSDDRYSHLANLAGTTQKGKRPSRQKLRRSRYLRVREMGEFRKLLRGYGGRLRGPSHHRTDRRERRLLQRELYVGDGLRSAIEQAQQSESHVSRRRNALGRASATFRSEQNETHHEVESWHDSRRSGQRCEEFNVWEESETQRHQEAESSEVYDLVDCGPRHRFLIRNSSGEMFISHNSMSHGIDGLQESGSILVWFGLNWSLELYEQMNARIDRQGQTKPVSIIRILCRDTVDLAVADALSRKTDDQEGLKSALQRYRDGVTTNELEVNFF